MSNNIATIMMGKVNYQLLQKCRHAIRCYTRHAGYRFETYPKSSFVKKYGLTMYVPNDNADLTTKWILRILVRKYPLLRCKMRVVHESVFINNPPNHPPGNHSLIYSNITKLPSIQVIITHREEVTCGRHDCLARWTRTDGESSAVPGELQVLLERRVQRDAAGRRQGWFVQLPTEFPTKAGGYHELNGGGYTSDQCCHPVDVLITSALVHTSLPQQNSVHIIFFQYPFTSRIPETGRTKGRPAQTFVLTYAHLGLSCTINIKTSIKNLKNYVSQLKSILTPNYLKNMLKNAKLLYKIMSSWNKTLTNNTIKTHTYYKLAKGTNYLHRFKLPCVPRQYIQIGDGNRSLIKLATGTNYLYRFKLPPRLHRESLP